MKGKERAEQGGRWGWILRMAFRDGRKSRGRLFIVGGAVILGIAALVAIQSFRVNLRGTIDNEARSLLGADLKVEAYQPYKGKKAAFLDSLPGRSARARRFFSMLRDISTGKTRLVNVKAFESPYPFYGELTTDPSAAAKSYREGKRALLSSTLMRQFEAEAGDSIQLGDSRFSVAGTLEKLPGQSSFQSSVAPVVCIPLKHLSETGLVKEGSRIRYIRYLKHPTDRDPGEVNKKLEPRLEELDFDFEAVEGRRSQVRRIIDRLAGFLNLVGFTALLLGCIGVASAVHIYAREKKRSAALLRCIGASSAQAFYIYLVQVATVGALGAIIGAFLGTLVQTYFPVLFEGFLPFQVSMEPVPVVILSGVGTGLVMTLLFAMSPLLSIRGTPPLMALDPEAMSRQRAGYLEWGVRVLIFGSVFGFSLLQLGGLLEALAFTAFLAVFLLALIGLSRVVVKGLRSVLPSRGNFAIRQGLANLYRPNNLTTVLILAIGVGTALISTIYFSRDMLMERLSIADQEGQPDMILWDIQPDQIDSAQAYLAKKDFPVIQNVPVVTMRIRSVNGRSRKAIKQDSTLNIEDWTVDREYRATYRDTLIGTEDVIEGEWNGEHEGSGPVKVSIAQNIAEEMDLSLMDTLVFNVQGALMETVVGSIRKIRWQRVQTNFLVLFPNNVLESAPKTYVLITRTGSRERSAELQQSMVRKFPNISAIDLHLILDTINRVIRKVSFVIGFMAFFCIATGGLILIGSLVMSRYERMRESVLLRTLGASRRQVLAVNAVEYLSLGAIASVTGVLFSLLAALLLAWYQFQTIFAPTFFPILTIVLTVSLVTLVVGVLNTRSLLGEPPLEVLRKE